MVILGDISDQKVPSLIFIELLENALKHGNIQQEGAFVNLKLTLNGGSLEMICSNSIEKQASKSSVSTGVGLENIRKRLHLQYPENHDLEISQNEYEFVVSVRLRDV